MIENIGGRWHKLLRRDCAWYRTLYNTLTVQLFPSRAVFPWGHRSRHQGCHVHAQENHSERATSDDPLSPTSKKVTKKIEMQKKYWSATMPDLCLGIFFKTPRKNLEHGVSWIFMTYFQNSFLVFTALIGLGLQLVLCSFPQTSLRYASDFRPYFLSYKDVHRRYNDAGTERWRQMPDSILSADLFLLAEWCTWGFQCMENMSQISDQRIESTPGQVARGDGKRIRVHNRRQRNGTTALRRASPNLSMPLHFSPEPKPKCLLPNLRTIRQQETQQWHMYTVDWDFEAVPRRNITIACQQGDESSS